MSVSIAINRNSETFDKLVADELNSAFYKINKKIEEYKSEDLDYKYKVTEIINSNSFITENILYIRESFKIEKPEDIFVKFIKIKELPINVPFDVWGTAVSTDSKSVLTYHILGKEIFITGNTFLNQTFCIIENIIIP